MRFTSAILATLAAPLLAFAQTNSTTGNGPNYFKIPTEGIVASAGKTTTLQWQPTTGGTVTLILRSGASNNLNQGAVIASNIPNDGSYSWSVPNDITRGSDYAVEIVSESGDDVNYTGPFVIDSTNTVASSTGEVTLGVMTASAISTTGGSNSASATNSASMTGSSASSAAASASGSSSATGMSSGSMTSSGMSTMTSGASSSGSSAASATQSGLQASSSSQAAGARATAMVGMLGAVALGALAL